MHIWHALFSIFHRMSFSACFILLIAKGFGSIFFMKLGVAIVLGRICYDMLINREYFKALFTLLACLGVYLQWPLVHLWGFWVFILFAVYGFKKPEAIGVCMSLLGLWLLQESTVGSWTAVPYISIFAYYLVYFISMSFKKSLFYASLILCMWLTSWQIYKIMGQELKIEISHDPTVMPSYSPGPLLAKILNGTIVEPGSVSGDVGISSIIFDKGPYQASRHILLSEHDIQVPETDPVLRRANSQQLEPWFANQPFGNQYLLEAVARDGLWMANFGGSLNTNGKLLLGSLRHQGDQFITPLVVEHDRFVYVQDSDSFVDRIVPHQENIVREIVVGRVLPRILNLCFCGLILMDFTAFGLVFNLVSLGIILGILGVSKSGDVRIVAKTDWPHEPSKASGVMTSLVDNGFNFRRGDIDARVLVVGTGQFAVAKSTEVLVILEPEASVKIEDCVIRADKKPIGTQHEIIDCRNLLVDDCENGVKIVIDNTTVVGTGSPAKMNWKKWIAQ